jgi:oxygen-dependent protoporphyrinogen oxidase
VAGAWLAGTGLVAVVADARARSRQLAAELATQPPSS